MQRHVLNIGLAVISALGCAAAPPAAPTAVPLHGTWKGNPVGGCSEVLEFRPDNVLRVESSREVLQGTYVARSDSGAQPALQVERIITHSNQQPDCNGRITVPTGARQIAFAFFAGNDTLRLCFDRQGNRCIGTFSRTR